jgi:hypothetical protein
MSKGNGRKPGLADAMRNALRYKDWDLGNWKNVIWSVGTSVVLGHRRGGTQVWSGTAR